MSEFLLELLSEEIPARMQGPAAQALERAVNDAFLSAGFMPEGVKGFAGPRRLTVAAAGLPARQPDRREEKKGPRVGAPEKAIEGFLRSAGLSSLDECEQREDKKGQYYVAVIDQKGRDTADLIAEFMPDIVRGFSWSKSMRWGATSGDEASLKWVRPLHTVLCVFDGDVVEFDIDGVRAGDITEGHRFMAPGVIQTRGFEDYALKLRNAKIILDADERREIIAEDASTLCKAQGLELVADKGLLNEVAGLAEWPIAMMGTFDKKFLALPDEVLTASMRGHQKYFSVADPKTGRLANKFIYVANIEAPDGGAAMREGYERVLTARLSDGWYLYQQDLKTKLEDRAADLDKITFFEGLGSVGDRVQRIAALAREMAPSVGADPKDAAGAALLAKTDLVTGMVAEFPELQGVMGRYYALEQGADGATADAIRDHYKPSGQGDDVPTAPVSVALALADKIDTLTAFWAIDKKPTGSSDPFALRRSALGVIAITLGNSLRQNLTEVFAPNFSRLATSTSTAMDQGLGANLIEFFHDRLKVHLRDDGARHDHVDAVRIGADGVPHDDLVLVISKLKALEGFLKSDDGENLVAAFKRSANILKAEEKKGDLPDAVRTGEIVPSMLKEEQEKTLYATLLNVEGETEKALGKEAFDAAMSALSSLRAPLDAFFEDVTVNDDDAALRANRLALLARFRSATRRIADFSKLQG